MAAGDAITRARHKRLILMAARCDSGVRICAAPARGAQKLAAAISNKHNKSDQASRLLRAARINSALAQRLWQRSSACARRASARARWRRKRLQWHQAKKYQSEDQRRSGKISVNMKNMFEKLAAL